jgi:hypothetical protein
LLLQKYVVGLATQQTLDEQQHHRFIWFSGKLVRKYLTVKRSRVHFPAKETKKIFSFQ